jgi:hypothetical protein
MSRAAVQEPVPLEIRAEVAELQAFVASLPDRDGRTADEILGYDDSASPAERRRW